MGELNIEKVADDKFVKPEDGYKVGYYGYTPDDSDADSDTVAVQGPLAEEQYKKSDSEVGAQASPKSASKPATRASSKEADK